MISKHDKKNKKTLAYKPFTSQNGYMKINNFNTISIIKITMYHLQEKSFRNVIER